MKYKLRTIILLVLIFAPSTIFAATLTASSEGAIMSGDTSIIDVYLNTEGEVINSIDGSILLTDDHGGNFEVKDFSLVSSVFSMWPRKPSLEDGHKVVFVGGIPAGIKGDRLLLFKVIVKVNAPGKFSIKPSLLTAYLNDGLGTARAITKNTSVINVELANGPAEDNWQKVISSDNTAPLPFAIELGQEASLYDGKKFISFEATDQDSGISYYEVTEGAHEKVRSGTTYVLLDQDERVNVTVAAYDKAGNFQVARLVDEPIHWLSILIAVIIITIIYKIIRRIKRNKKNKQNAE